jgi:hypothetical protein
MMSGSRRDSSRKYKRGELVEVRARDEIVATLDADGKLDGLPFQPEMLDLCGGKFNVYRRAEKVFLDMHYRVAALKDTVLLADLRCDGKDHGGCKMGCLLLWKEAWLKPASGESTIRGDDSRGGNSSVEARLPVAKGDHYSCQATELVAATSPVAWWDIRQYVRDLASSELTPRQFARMLMLSAYNKTMRILGRPPYGEVYGRQTKTPACSLNLIPGELVEVKTKGEIRDTLDSQGKNRGLGFGGNMVDYCGGRYRVANRVDRLILEWSGEMRNLTDTVSLEEVTCDGLDKRGCPRLCYHLWREIWLKRVP